MALPDLNKLCTPAQLYLLVTLFSLTVMVFQNVGMHSNVLCVGNYKCHNAPNKTALVFVKLIYISFWTFVLQMICKGGYKNFAWFLVLLPVILFMLLLIFALGPWTYTGPFIEGMVNLTDVKTPSDAANYVSDRVNNQADKEIKIVTIAGKKLGNDVKISGSKCRELILNFANRIKEVSTKAATDAAAAVSASTAASASAPASQST